MLLLDEPLSALDLAVRRQLQGKLKEIHRTVGTTFIYVTHDQEEALSMSDRVAVMRAGRVQQIGTPKEIYQSPVSGFVAKFLGLTNVLASLVIDLHADELELDASGLRLATGRPAFAVSKGESVNVVVRPDLIALSAPVAGAGAASATTETNVVNGTVEDVKFAGSIEHYRINARRGEWQVTLPAREADFLPGSRVRLSWPRAACVVVPGD